MKADVVYGSEEDKKTEGCQDGALKKGTGASCLARPGSLLWLCFCLLPIYAPLSILAFLLIAIVCGFAETVEVAFS